MSNDMPQQTTPVIIKGGKTAEPIEIHANSIFQITEKFQSQPDEWIQSDSDYSISYIESVAIGEMGADLQFCQTSAMAHPLTYEFRDSSDNNIFTITEVANAKGFYLQIAVAAPGNYFQVTQSSQTSGDAWTVSAYGAASAEIYAVEVTDANKTPVCRLVRSNGDNIFLSLEPS